MYFKCFNISLLMFFGLLSHESTAQGDDATSSKFDIQYGLSPADYVASRISKGDNAKDVALAITERSKRANIDALLVAAAFNESKIKSLVLLKVAMNINRDVFIDRSNIFIDYCIRLGETNKACTVLYYLQLEKLEYDNLTDKQLRLVFKSREFWEIFKDEDNGARSALPFLNDIKNNMHLHGYREFTKEIKTMIEIINTYSNDPINIKGMLLSIYEDIDTPPPHKPTNGEGVSD